MNIRKTAKMAEEDIIKVFFERKKTGRIDVIRVDVQKFRKEDEYKSEIIHELIKEIYRKAYRGDEEKKEKANGG